jgi:voltage-gated potassium channel
MQLKINQLQGHVVVCGFGRMGRSISARLASNGASIVVIEQDPQGWQDAIDQGFLAVRGCGTDDANLQQAGIERAAGAACVMDSDADNTFCVLSVRELNESAFIACRADSHQSVHKLERAGATFVVCPYAHAGIDVANAILDPNHAQLYKSGPRSQYGFEMSEMQIAPGSILDGRSIAEFGKHANSIVFVALRRPGQEAIIRPGGHEHFLAGDIVVVAGKMEELSCVLELAQTQAVEAA